MTSRARAPRTFAFLGISGSGKGTQAGRLLRALRGARNLSTGEELRRISRKRNRSGRFLSAVLHRGGLVPYWAASYSWLGPFIERLSGDEPLVFDGSPRRIGDARIMDDVMRDTGRALPFAIYLKLSPAEAFRRLRKRGRYDDHPHAIRNRFRFFSRWVRPVIGYYRRRGRLITVNGEQSVGAVRRDIRKALRLR